MSHFGTALEWPEFLVSSTLLVWSWSRSFQAGWGIFRTGGSLITERKQTTWRGELYMDAVNRFCQTAMRIAGSGPGNHLQRSRLRSILSFGSPKTLSLIAYSSGAKSSEGSCFLFGVIRTLAGRDLAATTAVLIWSFCHRVPHASARAAAPDIRSSV